MVTLGTEVGAFINVMHVVSPAAGSLGLGWDDLARMRV